MLLLLHPVLVIYVATFTSADLIDTHVTIHESSLDGKVSNERLLFVTDVYAQLECASLCTKYVSCAAFSTSPADPYSQTMTCRGHDSLSVLQSSTVAAAGSKTYLREWDCASEDLQPFFLRYPKRILPGKNIVLLWNVTECRQTCLDNNECLTFDVDLATSMCLTQYATATSPGASFKLSDTFVH